MSEFEDAVILQKVHRADDDGTDDMEPEAREAYKRDAERFREVTRRMEDLSWDAADHAWLKKYCERSARQAREGADAVAERFEEAVLLMDGRKKNARGEDGADQHNARELRRLARRTGKAIAALGAYHDKPKEATEMRPEAFDDDEFKGLRAMLELCEGAPVLLTQNLWVEAGLMNGAMGTVKGYVWPVASDAAQRVGPDSKVSELRAPICVLVEFKDVDLRDEQGREVTFFPGDAEKRRWVPIFRETAHALCEEHVARKQFPLTLAWALTHWKAQGMTLRRARVALGSRAAGMPGVGYVAVTRVKHPRDLLLEGEFPSWETFQAGRHTPDFKMRQRFDLR